MKDKIICSARRYRNCNSTELTQLVARVAELEVVIINAIIDFPTINTGVHFSDNTKDNL